MKRRDLLNVAVNSLLSFGAGFCGIGCLVTAFDLPVSLPLLALACFGCGLLFCICMRWPLGGLSMAVAGSVMLRLMYTTDLLRQLQQILYRLTDVYHRGYGFAVPSFAVDGNLPDVTLAAAAVAVLATMAAAFSLSRRRAFGAVAAQVLLLLPCLVVTDTPPESLFVFWMLANVALVLLSHGTRRADPKAGSRLVLLLLVPVLLVNWLVMAVVPSQSYQPPNPNALFQKLEQMFYRLPFMGYGPVGTATGQPDATWPPHGSGFRVELGNAGPKIPSGQSVMTVISSRDGMLYLRGRSYGMYDGRRWYSEEETAEPFVIQQPDYLMGGHYFVHVTTKRPLDWKYHSYYAREPLLLQDGIWPNEAEELSYTYGYYDLAVNWKTQWSVDYGQKIMLGNLQTYVTGQQDYLQLPEQTRSKAQALLDSLGIYVDVQVLRAVEQVEEYVRHSAEYDLNTPLMDADAEDFALWFLEDSPTGYCVHFATAAVVLLRAAGIPARYVEGYALQSVPNVERTVRQYHAHAWVEYYLPHAGWIMLEVTPSAFTTVPPDIILPPTTSPTAPTVPTEPTRPTIPSVPGSTSAVLPTLPSVTGPGTGPSAPTTLPSVPVTTAPDASSPSQQPQEPSGDSGMLWRMVRPLGIAVLVLAALILQRILRIKLRSGWLHCGSPNRQALACWRYSRYLAKLRRQQPPEALHTLALKAKFSQHTLTEEELQQFADYFRRSVCHLQKRSWILRLGYRLILAIW